MPVNVNLPLPVVSSTDFSDKETEMARYKDEGTAQALAIDNRGPVRFGIDGKLNPAFLIPTESTASMFSRTLSALRIVRTSSTMWRKLLSAHQVKMAEPSAPKDAPEWFMQVLLGPLVVFRGLSQALRTPFVNEDYRGHQ